MQTLSTPTLLARRPLARPARSAPLSSSSVAARPRAVVARAPTGRPARRPILAPPRAAATSSGGGAVPEPTPPKAGPLASLKALATPFTDPVANGRLVALCVAQMLCSVATLIHDT